MESRAFIRQATAMVARIKNESNQLLATDAEEKQQREATQKDLNQLFSGLQNPSLPSASRLRDLAVSNGYSVNPMVQNRLQQAESYWVQ